MKRSLFQIMNGLNDLLLTQKSPSAESLIHLNIMNDIEYRVKLNSKFNYQLLPGQQVLIATTIVVENMHAWMYTEKCPIHQVHSQHGGVQPNYSGRIHILLTNLGDGTKMIPKGQCVGFLHLANPIIQPF